MGMYTISNDIIQIVVSSKGAELSSLILLEHGKEYIWQKGAEWPKSSPLLFPIVGSLKDGSYKYKGKDYSLSRHGFARDMEFSLLAQTSNSMTFGIQSSDETKAIYSFDFDLRVQYTLVLDRVEIAYEVHNIGTETMYFSIGAHPAFKVPLSNEHAFEDYELTITIDSSSALPIMLYPLTEDGLTQKNGQVYLTEKVNKIALTQDLFKQDALVFKGIDAATISIGSTKSDHSVTVHYAGFPFLGIWNKSGAAFVCIEPWCGITDSELSTGDIVEKEGIIPLETEQKWRNEYYISVK